MAPRIRTPEEVTAALKQMDAIRATGAMSDDVYHKVLVSLAYEYLMVNAQQEGLRLLMKVPASYYKEVQLKQMYEDLMYRDLVVLLSYKLIQLGIVEGADEVVAPNMFAQQGRA